MRRKLTFLLVALTLGWSAPATAQVPQWVSQLLTAAQLPLVTLEARREGVRNDEIYSVLDAVRRAGVPAWDATALIDTARHVRREHGPVDNFGAFVQSQLAAGKRGRELAAAIRAEHARSGKGPGTKGGVGQGRGSDDANAAVRGRSGSAGTAGGQGRGNDDKAKVDDDRGSQGKARSSDDTGRGRSGTPPGRPAAAQPGRARGNTSRP